MVSPTFGGDPVEVFSRGLASRLPFFQELLLIVHFPPGDSLGELNDWLRRSRLIPGDLLRLGPEVSLLTPGDLLRVGLDNLFGRSLLMAGDLLREGLGTWLER